MKLLQIFVVMGVFLFIGSLEGQTVGSSVVITTTSSQGQGLKGVPFSADVVNESTRILSDGTRIQQETHGKSFRDSEGRTRTESEIVMSVGNGDRFQHVTIIDPVQHVFISLDPKNKIATIRQWPVAPMPAAAVDPKKPATPASNTVHEALGTKEIEGFSAVGAKYTRTIETGKIGNDKPLVTVTESWFSADLKTVLKTKMDDPQSGQSAMRLANIQTGEPDPLLFQVPQGYTVNDTRTPK